MQKIAIADRTFDAPTTIVIEASWEIIHAQGLDTDEGEHFDRIEGVVSIEVERDTVAFITVRTHAAWKRGEPNAGRGRWEFPRPSIEAIWI